MGIRSEGRVIRLLGVNRSIMIMIMARLNPDFILNLNLKHLLHPECTAHTSVQALRVVSHFIFHRRGRVSVDLCLC